MGKGELSITPTMPLSNALDQHSNSNGGKMMKTIGVSGGIGLQAILDFEVRILTVPKQLNQQFGYGGYPPIKIYYYRHPHDVQQDT
jgi:hypothetical protein